MEETPVLRLLWRLSPPVMLALLIQSVYNIVDSFFVARYCAEGLTALSIFFPLQLLMTAVASGTGAGLGILLSRMDGAGVQGSRPALLKNGLFLGALNYLLFLLGGLALISGYFSISSGQETVRQLGVCYARIIFIGSFGQFWEGICTKSLQAKGNMLIPMAAQITGAAINVALDPLLIFGLWGLPELGVAGAALATVIGQIAAMLITLIAASRRIPAGGRLSRRVCREIYASGLPSIVMQSLYTLYIIGLNLILKRFTEDAVTVLGIYYKLQTFFFIPLMGFQQVILPLASYNFGAGRADRLKALLRGALGFSCALMLAAALIFWAFPRQLLSIFSDSAAILEIGGYALRVIAVSFVPAGAAMILTVYFQGVSAGSSSLCMTVLRQVLLLVPLAWLFHFAGLQAVWYTFPVTEGITLLAGGFLYRRLPCPPQKTESF